MNRVDGKVAIVTGGGSGIGAATSRLLAQAGARVVVTDIDARLAGEIAKEILEEGGQALALHHDVIDETQWEEVIDKTLGEYGKLDVLVNNAGVSGASFLMFENQSFESWRKVLSVNLDAVFLGTQRAVLAMKDAGGSIVNISSVMGIVGGAGAAYNASKGGVRLLTKSVAVHCGTMGYNIRVNSVHPGYIWTPMIRRVVELAPAEANMTEDGLRAMLTERHPIGRLGVPEDIARGVLFLASDDSSFMTGSELVIDGGYTAV
jgi:3(or 17)beta-hydroxysteroid dehydrogenase